MKEDMSIFFNTDEHAVTVDYYPQGGEPVFGLTVILDEGDGNEFSRAGDIVSDYALIDINRHEVSEPDAGDEIHICQDVWIITGFAGADQNIVSLTAEKRRRPSYA